MNRQKIQMQRDLSVSIRFQINRGKYVRNNIWIDIFTRLFHAIIIFNVMSVMEVTNGYE